MPIKEIKKQFSNHNLSIKQIANVILNVNEYKTFIPHCTMSRIISESENLIIAEITISFALFKVSYTSKIEFTLQEDFCEIKVTEEFPKVFKKLLNIWKIKLKEGVIFVDFLVDFEIKNKLLNSASAKALPFISEIILNSFIKKVNSIC